MKRIRRVSGPAPTPAPAAWRDLLDRYTDVLAASGYPLTTRATRGAHLRFIARGLGVSPEKVTGVSLVAFFARQQHWARETRRGYRNTAVSFFTWAHREGLIATNPALDLPSVKPAAPAPRPAPDRVYRAALMAAEARVMLMLRLAAEAGLRRTEIARVHTNDLTEGLDGYALRVHGKGGKIRVVPITDQLAGLIAAGAAGHTPGAPASGWLFPGEEGGHLSPRWVGKVCAAALPGDWTLHKLRHRFASRAFRGTRNLRAVQTLLGHASVATTERYTAVDDAEVRAAMQAASEPAPRVGRITGALGAIAAVLMLLAGLANSDTAAAVVEAFSPRESRFLAALTSEGLEYGDRTRVELVAYAHDACRVHDSAADQRDYLGDGTGIGAGPNQESARVPMQVHRQRANHTLDTAAHERPPNVSCRVAEVPPPVVA